ncbi:hypothetical protein ACOTTU_17060 [Roseobacter sp. EG26]|uniref:hypothetical protein n=1 Tax=Roseobacter sp. EG26 TaxID=3412477 RepID=UPI003CE47C5A
MTAAKDSSAAIMPDRLIAKLCFLACNGKLDEVGEQLKNLLTMYNKFRGQDLVSNSAIGGWFPPNSWRPTRAEARGFIYFFVRERVIYEDLSNDQKKVYRQILDGLEPIALNISAETKISDPSPGVHYQKNGSLVLPAPQKDMRDDFLRSWQGVYVSFRRRLLSSQDQVISREVVQISLHRKHIRYQHWHLKDGETLSFFSGGVCITKTTSWFVGESNEENRLRVCQFKNNTTQNQNLNRIRWGLMQSDIPIDSSRDPAAARIVWIKESQANLNLPNHISKTVGYVSQAEIQTRFKDFLLPAINNAGCSDVLVDGTVLRDGPDPILRVNQAAVENFALSNSS